MWKRRSSGGFRLRQLKYHIPMSPIKDRGIEHLENVVETSLFRMLETFPHPFFSGVAFFHAISSWVKIIDHESNRSQLSGDLIQTTKAETRAFFPMIRPTRDWSTWKTWGIFVRNIMEHAFLSTITIIIYNDDLWLSPSNKTQPNTAYTD